METAEFIRRVVAPKGFIYTGWQSGERFYHKVFTEADEAAKHVRWLSRTKSYNTYLALATFKLAAVEANGKTRPHRTQENVAWVNSLWIDVDVGEGKNYETTEDAAAGLAEFIRASDFPKPSLGVKSGGGGMHLYWVLDEPLTKDEWLPMARGLGRCAQEHGWHVDQKCTTDCARVLRPIGTSNYKYDPARPVELFWDSKALHTADSLRDALKGYMAAPEAEEGFILGPGPGADNDDLVLRRTKNYKMANIIERCPVYQNLATTRGAGESYPFWKDYLHTAAYCEDGLEWAHELSNGHAGYSRADTAFRFNESLKAKSRTGPTRCDTFAKHKPAACALCPNNGKIKSPIVLGEDVDDLPYGFKRQNGDIVFLTTDDDGNPATVVLFKRRDIQDFHIEDDPLVGYKIFFTLLHGNDRTPCDITYIDLHKEPRRLSETMARFRVSLDHGNQIGLFKVLMTSWVEKLAASKQHNHARPKPFGWYSAKQKLEAFAVNGTAYFPGGETAPTVGVDGVIMKQYAQAGSIEPWKVAVAGQLTDGRMPLLALLASSFAAPLVDLTGLRGLALSLVSSKSGVGKSSAMRVAAAVWGHPTTTVFALDDTEKSVAYKLGMIRNLPAYWDELRIHKDVEMFGKLLFQLNQGKERSRLTSEITARDMGSWATIITVASNQSVRDHMQYMAKATSAGVMRVFEMYFDDPPNVRTEHSDTVYGKSLDENHGHAGVLYAQYLVNNAEMVKNLVTGLNEALKVELKITTEERFWGATIAVLLAGAALAKQAGLVDFDPRALKVYLLAVLAEHRDEAVEAEVHVGDVLEQFFAANQNNRLITNVMPSGPGRLGETVHVMNPLPRDEIVCQVALKTGAVRIKQRALLEYAYKLKLSHKDIKAYMVSLGAKQHRSSLGAGTTYASAQTSVWTVDLKRAGLEGIVPYMAFEEAEKLGSD